MDNNQLEKLIKVLELDHVHDWETIQVLWILQNNMSWRCSLFSVEGFDDVMPADLIEEDVSGDGSCIVKYYELGDDESWEYLAMWLKDVVFNRGGLDLNIFTTTVSCYGDEGGPGLTIALVDRPTYEGIADRTDRPDEGFNFRRVTGDGLLKGDKIYYLYTHTM